MLKAVIYDLDNTLCDTTKALSPSFNTCYKLLVNNFPDLQKKQFDELNREVFDDLTHKQRIPLYSSQALFWHEMFDRLGLPYDPAIIKDLILLLNDELAKNVELFPGIKSMLQGIKKLGVKTAILSNGPYIGKALRFEYLNLKDHIDLLVSTDLIRRDKPSPRAFRFVLQKLKVRQSEALFLGDEIRADIKGANSVGIKSVLNTWNAHKIGNGDKSIKPSFKITKPSRFVEIAKQML